MATTIDPSEINDSELTEVYNHPDAKVDIVLVHGLSGHPRLTWTAPKNGMFWPSQLLPTTLKNTHARVLVYGYKADVVAFGSDKSASSDMIHQHAQTLIQNLAIDRRVEQVQDHPIIFVCHSLGGILVKRALELSNDITSPHANDNRNIYVSTYGIIFLGTPHTGSDAAKWGIMLERMASAFIPKTFMHTNNQLVKTLISNNETLQNINLHFVDISPRFRITAAHEELATDMKGTKALIVDQLSANPPQSGWDSFGIAATHSGMCKFENKNSPGYKVVSGTLLTWIQEAPATIRPRQEMETRQRRQKLEFDAHELTSRYSQGNSPAASNHPSMNNSMTIVKPVIDRPPSPELERGQYFIKPSGFRPNSYFVGRESEMAELHKMLFDKKKRSTGTSAVLIQSLPGGGKTHLARQYVFEHREKFPGGVFWLRAKSETELAANYWEIACKAALRKHDGESNSSEEFIKTVRKWLNNRHDWLMVLDGINFTPGLQKFIPDNTNTSLIYTSTERSAAGNYLWMSPQLITLQRLKATDAQHLFLLELEKKEPYSKEDLKNSMELVQSMEYLPVVIHMVAQRLKLTDEHLGKFARSYASEPRLRGLGAYIAVVDQLKVLGAYEALNLMYIMSFFSQHIPVQMLKLGLRALDDHKPRVPVRASEPGTGSTLNNTFRILITFALVERNAQEDSLQNSLSSKGSRDMLSSNIDVVRLHSVVQGFFVDTLLANEDKKHAARYSDYLARAVEVFCCSYDVANDKIARQANAGLVEDYRVYEIHGTKLREHLVRHKKIDMPTMLAQLDLRLASIKTEIDQRTPESSTHIASGRPDVFQVSVFDPSSSSSDTGPDTPSFERKTSTRVSTWGFDTPHEQHYSPHSIKHGDMEFQKPPLSIPSSQFPSLQPLEDPGYDSDRESLNTMTAQPSRHTVKPDQNSPSSPGGAWEVVQPARPRREKSRPPSLDLRNHRTTKLLEGKRYRDSAGAFRVLSDPRARTSDPRLSEALAKGYVENAQARNASRGRMSLSSEAQESLASISKNSPPPARGGGMIMDRRTSSQRAKDKRISVGTSTYAQAVSGGSTDVIGIGEHIQPTTEPVEISSATSTSTLEQHHIGSPAREALQRLPIEVQPPSPRSPSSHPIHTPMPPYPETPAIEYDQPFDSLPRSYSQENLYPGPATEAYPPNYYPRMTGPIPYETRVTRHERSSSSPLRYEFLSSFPPRPASNTTSFTDLPDGPQRQRADPLSLSSPNIRMPGLHSSEIYIPGHPELSHDESGYTSQPMSRDPSGQSAPELYMGRRPSLTVTEPEVRLPVFSPRIGPTSYQIKSRLQDEAARHGESRRGSRIVDMEDWRHLAQGIENMPPPRRFNPNARAFEPGSGQSPVMPSAPPNSMRSNPSQTSSRWPSPLNQSMPFPVPSSQSQAQTPYPDGNEAVGGEAMGRSTSGGSGGMVVDGQIIEFGEGVGVVRVRDAKERAEMGWRRIKKGESLREGK